MKTIIFDFDGVLADSFSFFYKIIKTSMESIGRDLTEEQYRDFFRINAHQAFKDFIGDEDAFRRFAQIREKEVTTRKEEIKLFDGVEDMLDQLNDEGYVLSIASSGSIDLIRKILIRHDIDDLFEVVLARPDLSKSGKIREILNRTSTVPEEAVMISDTVGDILVAKEMGLETIAVTWGYHSFEILQESCPDDIVNSIEELGDILSVD
jgi:phosphoglycolate phosphatase